MAVGSVVQGLSPMVFATLMEPHVRMAIWSRPSPCVDPGAVTPMDARCDGRWIGAPMDTPDWLLADIEALGEIFSAVLGEPGWRAQCERVVQRACPRFHQDAVPIRLITTYAGPGSEWAFARELEDDLDARTPETRRRIRTLAPGEVAILKGSSPGWEPWPDFPVVLHRSPPASRSAPRLVLTVDPFELSASNNESPARACDLPALTVGETRSSCPPANPASAAARGRPLLLSCALMLGALMAFPAFAPAAPAAPEVASSTSAAARVSPCRLRI